MTTSREDLWGNRLSGASEAGERAYNLFADRLLRRRDPSAVLDQAEIEPDCPMLQAAATIIHWGAEDPAGLRRAQGMLDRARAGLGDASEREILFVHALDALVRGTASRATALFRRIGREHPRDPLAAWIGQVHFFNLGDEAGMLGLASDMAQPTDSFTLGMLGFALEQNGLVRDAERLARRAVELDGANPWAQHAVAHALETQGRVRDGIAWMTAHAPAWDGCGSTMYTHNWWHKAVFHLDAGDVGGALDIFDRHLWMRDRDATQDQMGAVSMLSRMELRGAAVGSRWDAVADRLEARTGDHVEPFLDLHYLYGLARAGRDGAADRLLAGLIAFAPDAPADRRPVWRDIVVPLGQAMVAHARGRWHHAALLFDGTIGRLTHIGGSRAQRDWFHQLHLDSLAGAGRLSPRDSRVTGRLDARPGVPHPFIPRQRFSMAS